MKQHFAVILSVLALARADVILVPEQYPTIRQGIDAARSGDIVLVAPGRYVEEINLKPGVIVRGDGEGRSIIDGGGDPGDVVRALGDSIGPETRIEGFTITGASNSGGMPGGGGILCDFGARPEITNCRVEDNDHGVALWNGSSANVHNCVIIHNRYNGVSTSSAATVINNTIHDCFVGYEDHSATRPLFMNNIVTNCTRYGVDAFTPPPQLKYNNVWGNQRNYNNCEPDTGSISFDPLYVDPTGGDYRLQPGSPCIDAGNPASRYNDRNGTRNDIGAYGGPSAQSPGFEVVALTPGINDLGTAAGANVSAGFNHALLPASVNSATFQVRGRFSGPCPGTMIYDPVTRAVTLNPARDFLCGEPVTATLSRGIRAGAGDSLSGFNWQFTTEVLSGTGRFGETLQTPVVRPECVTSADFDRDGNLDVAYGGRDSSIWVLLGRGDGTLEPGRRFQVGNLPNAISAVELTGDTFIDLVAGLTAESLAVLVSQGNGNFDPAVTYYASNGLGEVASADLDLDGDNDVCITSPPNRRIIVFRNDGTGTLTRHAEVPDWQVTNGLALGDLNQDGWPDLVTGAYAASHIHVFLGRGDATFDTFGRFEAGGGPQRVRLVDANEDGILDAVTANGSSTNRISVLLGTGTGAFEAPTGYNPVGSMVDLLAADLNADDHLDLAVVGEPDNKLFVLFGAGNGTFGPAAAWPTAAEPRAVVAADFDNDGDLDLIAPCFDGNALILLLNDDALAVSARVPARYARAAPETTGVSAMFNKPLNPASLDSISFLVYGSQSGLHRGTISYDSATRTTRLDPHADFATGEPVTALFTTAVESRNGVRLHGHTWSFMTRVPTSLGGTFAEARPYSAGTQPRGTFAADFDSDGDIDLAVTCNTPAAVALLRNNGDGTFAAPVYTGVHNDPISLFGADLDLDGDIDLACLHSQSGTSHLEILKNDGTGSFTVTADYTPVVQGQYVSGGDIDTDGDIDLIVTDGWGSQNNVRVLRNDGTGVFSSPVGYTANNWARGILVADADNDADLDLLVANSGSGDFSLLMNDGTGAFAGAVNYPCGIVPEGICGYDFNADGWLDVATTHLGATDVNVTLNQGNGTFGPPAAYSAGFLTRAVLAADLDADSDLDLAVTAYGSDSVATLYNDGSGLFGNRRVRAVGTTPWGIAAADFNHDGALDLATANQASGSVSVLLAAVLGLTGDGPVPTPGQMRLYPNPFPDRLLILIPGAELQAPGADLRIYDLAGKLVRSFALPVFHSPGTGVLTLSWDGRTDLGRPLSPGVYFVNLVTASGPSIEKAILTR